MDVASGPDKQRGTMWYLLPDGKGATTRFKDAPPADMKPDPDYEPKEGEWFWCKCEGYKDVWYLFHRQSDIAVYDDHDIECEDYCETEYGHLCLPATPPE